MDAANKQLDKLPFNPSKMATAYLNAANAGRLYATGLIKMGVGILADGTVVLAPAGVASTSWGVWNLKSGTAALNRAQQQLTESLQENGTDRCWRNFLGVLPFGQEYDDPDEPSPIDVLKDKAQKAADAPLDFIGEIGTLGF